MGIRISSYEISGGHKGWDHSRYKHELPLSSSSGCLHPHSTASSFSASPCNHSIHSITLGFTRPSQWIVNSISYSAYSMFPSPLLGRRGPTRKHRCVHFCKVPSLSFSGSSVLVPCWNRVDRNEVGKFRHHWVTWCSAFSWSRWTDLKFPLTDKCFSCGVSLWLSRTFTSWGSPMTEFPF